MDHFGIGAAIRGAVHIYLQSARRTGRTVSLVESVKDGDRIFFTNDQEAKRVEALCLGRGIKIKCVVNSPGNPGMLFKQGTPQGRTIFDHTWVEQYYLDAIDRAKEDIDRLQSQLSGYGENHRATQHSAWEMSKWS